MVHAISAEKRALVLLTKEFVNLSYRKIAEKCGVSKSTAYAICNPKRQALIRKGKPGRPRMLTRRMERILLRTFHKLQRKCPSFSVKDLIAESGVDSKRYSRRTVSRFLNQNGYN